MLHDIKDREFNKFARDCVVERKNGYFSKVVNIGKKMIVFCSLCSSIKEAEMTRDLIRARKIIANVHSKIRRNNKDMKDIILTWTLPHIIDELNLIIRANLKE